MKESEDGRYLMHVYNMVWLSMNVQKQACKYNCNDESIENWVARAATTHVLFWKYCFISVGSPDIRCCISVMALECVWKTQNILTFYFFKTISIFYILVLTTVELKFFASYLQSVVISSNLKNEACRGILLVV